MTAMTRDELLNRLEQVALCGGGLKYCGPCGTHANAILAAFDHLTAENEKLRAKNADLSGILAARESGERERDDLHAQLAQAQPQAESYEIACEEIEQQIEKRAKADRKLTTQGSLVDGIGSVFAMLWETEDQLAQMTTERDAALRDVESCADILEERDAASRAHEAAERLLVQTERQRDLAVEALGRLRQWTHEHGAALTPRGADTYGNGVRDSKEAVARMLNAYCDALAQIESTPERHELNRASSQALADNRPEMERATAGHTGPGDQSRTEAARRDCGNCLGVGPASSCPWCDYEINGGPKPKQDRPSVHQASPGAQAIPPLLVDKRNLPLPVGPYAPKPDQSQASGERFPGPEHWQVLEEAEQLLHRSRDLRDRIARQYGLDKPSADAGEEP